MRNQPRLWQERHFEANLGEAVQAAVGMSHASHTALRIAAATQLPEESDAPIGTLLKSWLSESCCIQWA